MTEKKKSPNQEFNKNNIMQRFIKVSDPIDLQTVANKIGAKIRNDSDLTKEITSSEEKNDPHNIFLEGVSSVDSASEKELTFIINNSYIKHLVNSQAKFCIISPENSKFLPKNIIPLEHSNPQEAYSLAIDLFYKEKYPKHQIFDGVSGSAQIGKNCQIHPTAIIGEECVLGDGVSIGAYSIIHPGVIIGANSVVESNVVIERTIIGSECHIRSGANIGKSGFGYAFHDGGKKIKRINHVGCVLLGQRVDIGCNSCIDRGVIENTIIGDDTKIDNLVQVGHNVIIGENCFICAQVGIAGSTKIGNNVRIGGQAGIADHLNIMDNVSIAGQSGVINDIAKNETVVGFPATKRLNFWRAVNKMFNKV